ncbi:vWA domain-containing protein [Syntrophomonas curvata]
MQFFNPLALGFAFIIPLIILLYLLKPRRQEIIISSTYLWEQVLKDIEASNPWQRLKKNLLLLLQLLAAVLLLAALTRPYLPVAENGARHLVVVLDCSTSMAATDVQPSRFEAARQKTAKMTDQLGPHDRMTLIAMAEKPAVLVSASRDRKEIKQVLDEMTVTSGSADLQAVMAIVSAMAKTDNSISLLILSDGGVLPSDNKIKLTCPVKVDLIGKSSDNVGITTLATRHHNSRILTLARVKNFSPDRIETDVELRSEEVLLDVKKLALNPGEMRDIIWDGLPITADIIEARLSRKDIYSQDNRAWTVVQAAVEKRALLVTTGNVFMEKALTLSGALDLYKTAPANYLDYSEDYDFYIFDGWLPEQLPHTPMLILNPPPGNPHITVSGSRQNIISINGRADEPLLKYVDVNGWQMASARNLLLPAGFKTLLDYQTEPLLATGEHQGQRMGILGCDLHESNIPLQTGFPILINNLLSWLLPEKQGNAAAISSDAYSFTIMPGSEEIIVQEPDGKEHRYKPPFPAMFPTGNPGPYRFTQLANDRQQTVCAVKNSGNLLESDLKPRSISCIRAGGKSANNISNREIWPYLAALCLLVLLLEWEVYRRGY